MYYNNILSSGHKNSFDSQNSNKRNNTNNYYNNNSPNEIDNNFSNIINDINVKSNENEDSDKNNNSIIFKAFSHVFDANISEVKGILTDNFFFINNCNPSIIDNVTFTKNNFTNVEGNIISFRWKKFYTLELICTKAFFSKTYTYYTLTLVNLKPVNIGNLEMNFKYYYNTCQNNTLFIIEYILGKGILSEVFKEEFLEKDMTDICNNCQNIINQRKEERNHLSTIFFNTSKEIAWKCIMDSNRNRYNNYMNEYDLVYMTKDNIEFDNANNSDKNIKKGDIIIIKGKKNKIFVKLIIDDIIIEKDKNEIIFSCDNNNENNTNEENNIEKNNEKDNIKVEIIKQKISLSIKEISRNVCFCEFKHTWNEPISDEKIKILNFLKNNSLILIKKILDETNDKNIRKKQNININKDNNTLKNNKELNKDDNKNTNDIPSINFFSLLCPVKK